MSADLRQVIDLLSEIDAPPGLRSQCREGDLQGAFDQWFDGGAIKIVTGWNEYHFANGAMAVVSGSLALNVTIRLPSGVFVTLNEHLKGSPPFPFRAV